jgi:hypothetical protein
MRRRPATRVQIADIADLFAARAQRADDEPDRDALLVEMAAADPDVAALIDALDYLDHLGERDAVRELRSALETIIDREERRRALRRHC